MADRETDIDLLREKLEDFRQEYAVTANAEEKFELKVKIREIEREIKKAEERESLRAVSPESGSRPKPSGSEWLRKNLGIGIVILFTLFAVIVVIQLIVKMFQSGDGVRSEGPGPEVIISIIILAACGGFATLGKSLYDRQQDTSARAAE